MSLLLFFFIFSIAFSFLCSVLEAVLLSVTPSYVNNKVQSGTVTGQLLEEYKKDIDRPLSAILTLNTIAHTVGAIGVGVQAGKLFGSNYLNFLGIHINLESIIATIMTLAILILSEIIPKTIGANNWKLLSPFTVKTIRILIWVLYPLVWVSQRITKTFKKEKGKSVLSRADFAAMTRVGEETGALEKDESDIIKNLLSFEKLTVRDIMTPKIVAFMVEEKTSIKDFIKEKDTKTFSRVPVYRVDRDNIIGIVLKDDALRHAYYEDDNKTVASLMMEVTFVQDNVALPELFNQLTRKKQHMHIVTDEYGSVVGIVTMEDLFETLLGREIVDESDAIVDLQKHALKQLQQNK